MKRLLALVLAGVMALSLAACGAPSSVSSGQETTAPQAEASGSETNGDLIPVTLQLKWVQQSQFMGYYVAKALGIYEKYGLDVKIVPGGSVDVIDEVDSNRAQFGTTWVSTAMSAISNGANVMIVGQYYQDSGMTLVSIGDRVPDKTAVVEGQAVGNWGGGNEYEMQSYLASRGLSTEYVTEDYDMQQLIDGELDWSSAMTYNEMGLMYEAGYSPEEINVLKMESEGFGMLEDCLIVDTEWAEANEATVLAFMEASALGWAWCLENPQAAGHITFNADDTANTVSEYHQQFEAVEVAKLVAGSIIKPGDRDTYKLIGYMDPAKYTQTYDIFSNYVDISNISAENTYTSYFYDLAISDEKFLNDLADFDSIIFTGTFDSLYTE